MPVDVALRDFCTRFAAQFAPIADVESVEIEYRWYMDDSEEGPFVRCRSANGSDLGNKLDPARYRQLSTFMLDEVDALRRSSTSSPRPNLLNVHVDSRGSATAQLLYSAQVDADYEQRQRKALGDAAYEQFERERTSLPAAPTLPSTQTHDSILASPSVPELIGFIHTELLKQVPSDWETLDVEGEVWSENGQRHVSTVYHYTSKGFRQRFTTTNTYGPMNALMHLQEQFQPNGRPWRKIKMQFKRDVSGALIDTH